MILEGNVLRYFYRLFKFILEISSFNEDSIFNRDQKHSNKTFHYVFILYTQPFSILQLSNDILCTMLFFLVIIMKN